MGSDVRRPTLPGRVPVVKAGLGKVAYIWLNSSLVQNVPPREDARVGSGATCRISWLLVGGIAVPAKLSHSSSSTWAVVRQDTVGDVPHHRRSTPPAAADGDPRVLLAAQVLHWSEEPRHARRPRGIGRGDAAAWDAALTVLTQERLRADEVSTVPDLIGRLVRHTTCLRDRRGHPTAPEPWLLDWAATEPDHVDPARLWSTGATGGKR